MEICSEKEKFLPEWFHGQNDWERRMRSEKERE